MLWLLVLYEIAVFIQLALTEVCTKVRRKLIDFCSNRLQFAVQAGFLGFERGYRQRIYYHFIDLSIAPVIRIGRRTIRSLPKSRRKLSPSVTTSENT